MTLNSVFFTDSNIGFLAAGGCGEIGCYGGIYKSTDGGLNWYPQNVPIYTPTLRSVYFINEDIGYAVGDFGSIINTTDGGTTWNILISGTYQDLYSVYFPDANTGYIVGDSGTILKTSNGALPVGIAEKNNSRSLKIYPNPASDRITIELSETGCDKHGTVSIYGMTGQEMIRQQVEDSRFEINVGSLPAGIYFVRLINQDKNVPAAAGIGKFVKY